MSSLPPWLCLAAPRFSRPNHTAPLQIRPHRALSALLTITLFASLSLGTAPVAADTTSSAATETLPLPPIGFAVSEFDVDGVTDSALTTAAELPGGLFEMIDEPVASTTPRATLTAPAVDISISTSITFRFSGEVDRARVSDDFTIAPETPGAIIWTPDGAMVFDPNGRLEPGTRYRISLKDLRNVDPSSVTGAALAVSGQTNFYFETRPAASMQQITPVAGEREVTPKKITLRFSQPMDTAAVEKAYILHDPVTGEGRPGKISWNDEHTVMTFTPKVPFERGRTLTSELRDGSIDADGNPVTGEWNFSTPPLPAVPAAAVPAQGGAGGASAPGQAGSGAASAPVMPPPAPATSLAGHALNQINAARAAHGFAPLYLDATLSRAASAHAADQLHNGYYSHVSLLGLDIRARLAQLGLFPGSSGENQCHYYSGDAGWVMNWCHSAFMSEPYPGQPNHIANILSPNFRRVGVGVASGGGHTIITWDFSS